MVGLIVTVAVSLAKPEPFSWETTRLINASALIATPSSASIDNKEGNEKDDPEEKPNHLLPIARNEDQEIQEDEAAVEEPKKLQRAFKVACIASFLLTFTMDFLIPIPMFLSHYIFSQGFFVAWVVITFAWVFCSTAISVLLPLWETAGFFKRLYGEVVRGGA